MNIDVTATDGDRTWSEKFTDIDSVEVVSGSLVIRRDIVRGRVRVGENLAVSAAFAPGMWHSWRRTD